MTITHSPEAIRAAITASRDHWIANRDATTGWDVRTGPDDCALCALFLDANCKGCPLLVSGNQCTNGGGGDPYSAAYKAVRRWRNNPTDPAAEAAFRAAAQRMVDVLEGLLK
jgi:hypothetical protein